MPVESASSLDLAELWESVSRLTASGRWHDAEVTLRAVAESTGSHEARISLGTLLADRGQLHAAVREWTRVIDSAYVGGDRAALSAVYHNLAAIYRQLGDVDLARRFQQRSLTLQDACGPEDLLQLANDALSTRSWDLAESLLDAAAGFASNGVETSDLTHQILATRGLLLGLRGRPLVGIPLLRRSFHQNRLAGNDLLAGKDLVNLAALFDQTERPGLAILCLRGALRYFRAAEDAVEVNRARYLLRSAARARAWREFSPSCN